ncbi:hypothetical protein [Capsulimonas corticalis]|uniref:hypothetical protein n=1 Tax=Capsulimonas corticalis TaxID=2219043 RepID=UPI000F653295|nr:hypothetical protein [Capsulimonas corticalis]
MMNHLHRTIFAVLAFAAIAATAHAGAPVRHAKVKTTARRPNTTPRPQVALSGFTLLPMSPTLRVLAASSQILQTSKH